MNIGFFIDKSQTVQSILGLLLESISRDHDCTVFSTCSPSCLSSDLHDPVDVSRVDWRHYGDRNKVKREVISNSDMYHALVGINLFNVIWKDVYETQNIPTNVYSVEYCWNEIYNHKDDYAGRTTLFSNSEWSKSTIEELTGYSNIKFLGSPWFELVKKFRIEDKSKDKFITFMAPHNSFVNNYSGFLNKTYLFLEALREYCDKKGFNLILKTRQKYNHVLSDVIRFDQVITDNNALDHLCAYSNSECVINFSSSAINELSFLEIPSLCVFPDLHSNLHKSRDNLFRAMGKINEKYYSGDIFDGNHCQMIESCDFNDYETFKLKINENIEKLDGLVHSQNRNWKKFQKDYFPGNHEDSASRIIDLIEKECVATR